MPVAYQCRRCKGPPLDREPEGPCPNCGGFYRHDRVNVYDGEVKGARLPTIKDGEPVSAGDLMDVLGRTARIETGMPGVDWVFGGGLPKINTILLASPEGVGKSTFLMELFRRLARLDIDSLYISAEQELKKLAGNFAWLGPFPKKHMVLHHAVDKDEIFRAIEKSRARVFALDSIHAVENVTDPDGFTLAKGQPTAVERIATDATRLASEKEVLIFIVGHVNNDGSLAGGAHLRHVLDANLVLRQPPGAREDDPERILRFERKTRFAPRGRRALFMMGTTGLEDRGPLSDEEAS